MPKEPNRITISAMPWRAGLTNQGGQATVPENTLWEAKNVDMDSTGRLSKRPGMRTWGAQLDVQPTGILRYTESFDDLESFTYASGGTEYNVLSGLQGNNLVFTTAAVNNGTDSHTYNRAVQPNDGTLVTSNSAIANLYLRAMTTLPAQSSGTGIDAGFAVHMRSNHAFTLTLLFLSTGIFYYNGAAFVIINTSTDMDDGRWHKLQVKITNAATGACSVSLDDATAVTFTATTYTDVSVAANQIAFSATTNSNAVYSMAVNLVQYAEATTLSAAQIKVLKDWSSINPSGSHLVCVTEDLIYEDRFHTGRFTSLDRAPSGDVLLVPWLGELLFCGSNDVTRRWNGDDKPILAPPEAPNNVIAGTAHQGRFFCASKDNPLLVRYSGANDLNVWTDTGSNGATGPAEFPIPDPRGRRITAMRGDFYGLLIIWTETSTWAFRTQGNPLIDGVLTLVSANIGCVGPRAHDAVGRDVLFLNKDGVYNLSTVQEYGDVASAGLSAKLRGLWAHNNQINTRKIVTNPNSSVVYAASENRVYVSVQHTGQRDVGSIYIYHIDTQEWTGPLEFDSTLTDASGGGMRCLDYVQVGSQGRQFLFIASSLGDVAYMGNDRRSDYPASISGDGYPVQLFLRSARIDGRSVSPRLTRRFKRWRGIWFYVLPRRSDSLKVTWNVDGNATSESATVNLNPYSEPILGSTFALGESALGDPERIGVVWIPLDVRGRWLEFTVELEDDTDEDDKDIVLVGFEIDATVGDEEKES